MYHLIQVRRSLWWGILKLICLEYGTVTALNPLSKLLKHAKIDEFRTDVGMGLSMTLRFSTVYSSLPGV